MREGKQAKDRRTRPDDVWILASRSPRRHSLLESLGFRFDIVAADVDETPAPGMAPVQVAVDLARRKAMAVAASWPTRKVIGADTIVVLDGRLLGKPDDAADARAMLRALSGTTHEVITGVCLVHASSGVAEEGAERTRVTMRPMSDEEIEAYVASGESFGKAGAYAIQESGDRFVSALVGPYDNVVGFPCDLFRRLARRFVGRIAGIEA